MGEGMCNASVTRFEEKIVSRPILLGHNFSVHPKRILRLLLPQGLAVPIAVSELFAVLQEIRERARQDSNLRPAD